MKSFRINAHRLWTVQCFICVFCLLLSCILPHKVCAANALDFQELFGQIKEDRAGEEYAANSALIKAFSDHPTDFIRALSLEDPMFREQVIRLLNQANQTAQGNADYIAFLLSLFPSLSGELNVEEKNTFLSIFLGADPKLGKSDDSIIDSAITALEYSDGIGTDQCGHILYLLFLERPEAVLKRIAQQESATQQTLVKLLHYDSIGRESAGTYASIIQQLSADGKLPQEIRNVLSQLSALLPQPQSTIPDTQPVIDDSTITDPPYTLYAAGAAAVVVTVCALYFLLLKKRK